jgi:hypothetical protein
MFALRYEEWYHNLPVLLDDLKTTFVNVRRYQNNTESLKENTSLGNKEALVKKNVLVGRMMTEADAMIRRARDRAAGKPIKNTTPLEDYDFDLRFRGAMANLSVPAFLKRVAPGMMRVHCGKGSPEEIQICLHLIAVFGLYDKKKFGTDSAAGVQDYCDKYIGLDCNGFVGNLARELKLAKEPETPIPYYAPKHRRRARIEDVQPNDVLVWTDNGHIAVIDDIDSFVGSSGGKPARDCTVVEATAGNPSGAKATADGGLQHSTYSIRSVGKDLVFNVERPKGKNLNRVYIAPLA